MTVTDEVLDALETATPVTSDILASAEQYISVPLTNPLLAGLGYANMLAPFTCVPDVACTIDRAVTPPYAVGPAIGSWVTAFRIGDVAYVSEPGEGFPEVSKAIRDSIQGASAVHVVGMAQDQLGYYWPPEEAPATTVTNDSDHLQYNSSALLGELTEKAARDDAEALGFTTTVVHQTPMQTDPLARTKPGVQFFAVAPRFGGLVLTVDSAVNAAQNGTPLVISSNPDGSNGSITYDWGDGSASYGGNPGGGGRGHNTHTYAAPGTYTVTGTVTDTNGGTRSWQQTVTLA